VKHKLSIFIHCDFYVREAIKEVVEPENTNEYPKVNKLSEIFETIL